MGTREPAFHALLSAERAAQGIRLRPWTHRLTRQLRSSERPLPGLREFAARAASPGYDAAPGQAHPLAPNASTTARIKEKRMSADIADGGQIFWEAWIAGVHKHFPGEPKPGYVAGLGRHIGVGAGRSGSGLLAGQRVPGSYRRQRLPSGLHVERPVRRCQLDRLDLPTHPGPKPSYVAEWNDLAR